MSEYPKWKDVESIKSISDPKYTAVMKFAEICSDLEFRLVISNLISTRKFAIEENLVVPQKSSKEDYLKKLDDIDLKLNEGTL